MSLGFFILNFRGLHSTTDSLFNLGHSFFICIVGIKIPSGSSLGLSCRSTRIRGLDCHQGTAHIEGDIIKGRARRSGVLGEWQLGWKSPHDISPDLVPCWLCPRQELLSPDQPVSMLAWGWLVTAPRTP